MNCADSDSGKKERGYRPHYTVIAEKTLFDVLGEVWRAKYVMAGFALVAAVLAFVFTGVAQRYYLAQMIVAPANPLGMAAVAVSGMEGTIGGGEVVAAGGQGVDAFTVFSATYNGRSVASVLMQDKEIIKELRNDKGFVFKKPKNNWTQEILSEYLVKHVHLDPVNGVSSPLRRLSYAHPDKKFASMFLTRIHRITDEMIRARILGETNQRIEYLDNALAKTNNPDHKRSLTALLMEQERQKMMVSLDQPYAASIIEPACVLPKTYWPDPLMFYPAFVFIGLLIGYIVAMQIRPLKRK